MEMDTLGYGPSPPCAYFFVYLYWALECDSPIFEAILSPFRRNLVFTGLIDSRALKFLDGIFRTAVMDNASLFTVSWLGPTIPCQRWNLRIGSVHVSYWSCRSESDFQVLSVSSDRCTLRCVLKRLNDGALVLRRETERIDEYSFEVSPLARYRIKKQINTCLVKFYELCERTFGTEYWKE
jgi:hypothetical protein